MTIGRGRPRIILRTAAVVSFVGTLMGCGVDPAGPDRHAPAEALKGTWRWVSSLDVGDQHLHTPVADGFEAELVFVAESERAGAYTYRRAGAPDVHGRFAIASEDQPGNDFIVIDRAIDFLERHAWVAAGADSLWLGGVLEGGYNSRYARVPE